MKILQSTVEKLLYYLLTLLFISIIVVGGIAWHQGNIIKEQTKAIEQNQVINSRAIKTYIACLLTLDPKAPTPITDQESDCFNKAPQPR